MACEKGHESTVLVLLQNGADPNLQNKVTSSRMMMMIIVVVMMMMIDDADNDADR